MSDGTVRGTFDLNTPAMGKLRDLRREGAATDRQMQQLGRTMDSVGGPTATRKLDDYSSRMRKLGSDADQMSARVSTAWDVQRRSVDDSATRIEGRIDVLDERMSRYGRQRVSATVELSGFDRVNAQLIELERRLDRLSRQRSSPSVGLAGGFGNMAGGGFPGGGAASSAGGGGGGGVGTAAKLAIGGAALLPGVQALGVSSVGLLGSAAGATLGAGVVGGGAVATLGTGALFSYAVAKPAVENLTKLDKAQVKYNETVRKYGDASKQAAVGRRELAAAESKMPGAGVALRQITSFRRDWERMTAPARNAVYGAVGNVAAAGRHALPTLSMAANTATSATAGQASNFAGYLAGYQQQRTLVLLTQQFATELPIVERSLQNVTTTMGHLALSARPFFHEADVWVEHWTGGLASSTTNEARVMTTMRGLVQETKDWGRLGGAAFRTIRDIFNMGRPSGDSMVVSLTQTLDRWDAWIQRNPAKVERFFREAQTTTDKIAGALVSITKLLSQAATALQPIFNRGMGLISALSSLGPGATTGLSALLYGGYTGFRNARGGAGPSAGAVLATGVLGRPMRGGAAPVGARIGGGTMVGAAGVSGATYLMPHGGGPTGAGMGAAGQLPLFLMQGRRTVSAGASTAARAAATPEEFAARYGGIEGARYAAPMSTIETTSKLGNLTKGALGGAAKTVGATVAIMAALEAAGKGGSPENVAQNFLSSGTFGLVHPVNSTGGVGAGRAQSFLGGLPANMSPAAMQKVIAAKITARMNENFSEKSGVLNPFGGMSSRHIGAPLTFTPTNVANSIAGLRESGGPRARNVADEIKALRRAYEEATTQAKEYKKAQNEALDMKQTERARSTSAQLGGAFGVEVHKGRSVQGAFGDVTGGVIREMKGMREAGSKVLGENTLAWARTMKRANPELTGVVDSLTKEIKARFKDLGQNISIVNGHILTGTATEWQSISTAMAEPIEQARERMSASFTAIQKEAIGSLKAMGFSPQSASQIVGNVERGGAAATHANAAIRAQQKGNAKEANQQTMAANLSPNKGHARGGMIGGHGLLDTVRVPGGKAAPGEAYIANRHTMADLSRATMEKFGKTAWQMIETEHRAHNDVQDGGILPDRSLRFARGGPVGNLTAMVNEANFIAGRHYPYAWGGGHNSNFTGPYDCSGAVSAVLHAGGALGSPEVASQFMGYGLPGPGTVTLFANPGHVYMRMGSRYFGTSMSNPGGGAAWFNGSPRSGFVQRHLEVTGGAGALGAIGGAGVAGGAAQEVHLRGRRSGLGGVPGTLADRGSMLFAAALQTHVNRQLAKGTSSVAGFAGGGGSSSTNEALGRRMMLAAGWGASEWPSLQALWRQESGWNANSVNSSSGAYGIPQALGHGHPFALGDAPSQIAWGLNYIRQRYGSPAGAESHERAFNWYSRGGRTPTWAGWHAAGGEYETRGPVIFGAGEGGRPERVSISPAGGRGKLSFGHGGHRIEVNIAHVTVASDADVEAVARQVAAKIVDELDALGEGPSDKELIGQ